VDYDKVNGPARRRVLLQGSLNDEVLRASNHWDRSIANDRFPYGVRAVNRTRHVIRIVTVLLLGVAIAGTPSLTYAQHSFGGGHFSGGHFGGGHSGGSVSHSFSGHYAGGAHYSGTHYAYSGARSYSGHTYYAPHSGGVSGGVHYAPRPGYYPGGYHPPGAAFAPATSYWHGGYAWAGGYWHGVFWPHVWFYPGWAWYLPVLPVGYATFWWGGVPYYYWNNLYYTWSPTDNGYVVSNPPPAANGDGTDPGTDPSVPGQYDQAAPASYSAPPPGAGSGHVYLYPRNGQSEEQTQNDRYECHSWAVNQTGFDPTRSQQTSGNAADYRRAMIACLDARGYSAR